MYSDIKGYEGNRLFFDKTPSHVSIPPNQNGTMAKAPCELEKYIGAESVRTVRQE